MADTQHQNSTSENAHPGGYEKRDMSPRAILAFGVGLVIVAVVIHLGLWWLFGFFADRRAEHMPPPSPLADTRQRIPPEPRLQIAPALDMQEMLAAELAVLHTYGWVDREAGVVRIPIERAMELLAERGLPIREQSGQEHGKEHEHSKEQ